MGKASKRKQERRALWEKNPGAFPRVAVGEHVEGSECGHDDVTVEREIFEEVDLTGVDK